MTDATSTEWIVIRPEGHIAGSPLASVYEGEWRAPIPVTASTCPSTSLTHERRCPNRLTRTTDRRP